MSSESAPWSSRRRLIKIGSVMVVCALAAFVIVYVVVAIAKPGSRAQRDVLAKVTGVGAVTSIPPPAAVITQPLVDYGEQPGGKAK